LLIHQKHIREEAVLQNHDEGAWPHRKSMLSHFGELKRLRKELSFGGELQKQFEARRNSSVRVEFSKVTEID